MKLSKTTLFFFGLLLAGIARISGIQYCNDSLATINPYSTQEIPHIDSLCRWEPYLEVKLSYSCTRCGQPSGGTQVMTATATGECSAGLICNGRYRTDRPGAFPNEWVVELENERVALDLMGFVCMPANFFNATARCYCPTSSACGLGSPIIVSLFDHQVDLTDEACGVQFDLDRDGIAEHLSWTEEESDEAFLFLDRNENGEVDDGGELFGDYSPQPDSDLRNGFKALAMFDDGFNGGNEDGVLSREDRIFQDLQLWVDRDHDGRSNAAEVYFLSEVGIDAIDLDYKESGRIDRYGNELRYWSFAYEDGGGEPKKMWDVFFLVGTSETAACRR